MKPAVRLRRVVCLLALVAFLVAFLVVPASFAQENEQSIAFSSQTEFPIPSLNGSVNFAMGGSYTYAALDNGVWNFAGLNLLGSGNAVSFPMPTGFNLSVSASNSNLTITRFTRLNIFPPVGSGGIEYTVSGLGAQTFNLYYYHDKWLNYSVQIDGVAKAENDGWNVTDDGWVTVTGATSHVKITYGARSLTAFTSSDHFDIPLLNSTISFEGTGTYLFTDLENGAWRFQNIDLNSAIPHNQHRWALGISAENCSVTVTGYLAPFGTMGGGWLNYTVVGVGTQTFDGDLEQMANFPLNYTVYFDGEKASNSSWTISDDGWVTVTGAKTNVSVESEPIIPDWFWDLPTPGIPGTPPPSSETGSSPAPADSAGMYASSPIPSMKGNPPVPSYADENAETRWLTALVVTITIVITVIVILFVAVAVAIRRNENVASV